MACNKKHSDAGYHAVLCDPNGVASGSACRSEYSMPKRCGQLVVLCDARRCPSTAGAQHSKQRCEAR